MPVREIKTTIALDGEQQFKKALADASREMRVMDSELKAVTAAYRANGDGAEYFASKQRNLKSQISQQEAIIKGLEQAVEDAGKAYGESSSQVDGYTIKLNNARAKLSQLEKQLSETDREVEELGRDSVKAGRQIEQGIGESSQEAEKDVKSLIKTLQNDLDSIRANTTFTAIGSLWDMAKGAYSAASGFVEQTAEYRRQLSFLELNAQNQGFDFDWIKEQMHEVQAVIGDSSAAVEGLSNLMNTPGMEENKLALAVDLLSGAVAAFPETLKFESLADSLQETIAAGEATGPFSELLNRLGINTEEFNEALSKSPTAAGDLDIALAYLASHGMKDMYNKWQQNNQAMQENGKLNAELESELGKLGGKIEEYITTPFTGLKLAATQKVLEVIEYVESELDKYAERKGYTQDKTGRSEPGLFVDVEYTPDPNNPKSGNTQGQGSGRQNPIEVTKLPVLKEVPGYMDEKLKSIDLDEYYAWMEQERQKQQGGNASNILDVLFPPAYAEEAAEQGKKAGAAFQNGMKKTIQVDLSEAKLERSTKTIAPVQTQEEIEEADRAGAEVANAYFDGFSDQIIVNEAEAKEILKIPTIAPVQTQEEIEKAEKAGAEVANAYFDGWSDQIIVNEAEAKEVLRIPTIAPVQTQEEIEEAERAGAEVANAYFDGWSDQIIVNEAEAIQTQSLVNMYGILTEGNLEEIIKGIDEKLENAQEDLEEAGEEAGSSIGDGLETAYATMERAARMAGANTARSYANGITSQLGVVASAASALASAATVRSSASSTSGRTVVMQVDGRTFAQGFASYLSDEMAVVME